MGLLLYADVFPLPSLSLLNLNPTRVRISTNISTDSNNPSRCSLNDYCFPMLSIEVHWLYNNISINDIQGAKMELEKHLSNLVNQIKEVNETGNGSVGVVYESQGWVSPVNITELTKTWRYGHEDPNSDDYWWLYGYISVTFVSINSIQFVEERTYTFQFSTSSLLPDPFYQTVNMYADVKDYPTISITYNGIPLETAYDPEVTKNIIETIHITFKVTVSNYLSTDEFVYACSIYDENNNIICQNYTSTTSDTTWTITVTVPDLNHKYYGEIIAFLLRGSTQPFYNRFTLIPKELLNYTLVIKNSSGGTTNPPGGEHIYSIGEVVTITAIPNDNYVFLYWIVDYYDNVTENPLTITMSSTHTIQPVFTYVGSDSVTLNIVIQGNGILDSYFPGTYTLKVGDNVTLYALPEKGYVFDSYIINGQKVTQNPYTFQITANTEVEVVFTRELFYQYLSFGLMGVGGISIILGVIKEKKRESTINY